MDADRGRATGPASKRDTRMTIIDAFFDWHRRHNVSGVEVGQVPLLVISALLLWRLGERPQSSPLIRDMEWAAPIWVWMAGLLIVALLLVLSLVNDHMMLHRWSLAAAASWWLTATFLIWHVGLTFISFLSASIYLFIGLSAWWRIAELAMREEAAKDE